MSERKRLSGMPTVHALQYVIWKIPGLTGSSGNAEDEYYDGSGNIIPSLSTTSSPIIRRYILGKDTIKVHYTNVNTLCRSLDGLSNFSHYAYTVIKDSNYNVIYDKLQYNDLYDLCNSIVEDSNFERMMYIEQYLLLDDTHTTPNIVGKNLAYWHLVGEGNYSKKNTGGLISDTNNFEVRNGISGGKTPIIPIGKKILLERISSILSNSFTDFRDTGGLSGYDVGKIIRPSEPSKLHSWPFLKGVNYLWDSISSSADGSPAFMVYDLQNFVVVPYIQYANNNGNHSANFSCNRVIEITSTFSPSFGVTKYRGDQVLCEGTVLWDSLTRWEERPAANHVWIGNNVSNDRSGNFVPERSATFKLHEIFKKYKFPNLDTKPILSTILLFEWIDDTGSLLYYTIKPISEDLFSIENTSDSYSPYYAYLLIEDPAKKPRLERVKIDEVYWPEVYNTRMSKFDKLYGFIGSISRFDIFNYFLRSNTKEYYSKYRKKSKNLKISVLLSDINNENGGYFLSPSKTAIVFDTSNLYVTEIKTKSLETANKSI